MISHTASFFGELNRFVAPKNWHATKNPNFEKLIEEDSH
jgi:hypothetical protein